MVMPSGWSYDVSLKTLKQLMRELIQSENVLLNINSNRIDWNYLYLGI